MTVCHYCDEQYEPTTEIEQMLVDGDDHPACSTCLFDVIANDDEIEPLPKYVEGGPKA